VASTAEVDLVISTADTLPELERDLNAIIRTAENGAPELNVDAALAVGESLSTIANQLDAVVQRAEDGAEDIDLQAALDTQRSLSTIQAQLESVVQRASQGEDIDLQAELDAIGSLSDVQRQVRALVETVEETAPPIELEVEVDRDGAGQRSILGLGRAFGSLIPSVGAVSPRIAAMGTASLAALPALAALTTAIESILPASALAVSGLTTLALTGGALALAFQGVGDAIKTAFDGAATAEELEKALAKLSPTARAFVVELRGMKKQFKELQQSVQNTFFQGLDTALNRLGKTVLPVVGTALRKTALELNAMALGAAGAASKLAEDGVLGQALDGSVKALGNLSNLPAQIVTGLGQIGAAAAPTFDRLTQAAAKAATGISEKLAKAFESGALEEAISNAVDAIAQLGRIAGNVFGGLDNIFDNLNSNGEGLFQILEKITQSFEDVTATQGFQQALSALFETLSTVVTTALPLLSQALQALGPIFETLAGPLQTLVTVLGEGLSKILTELGPVLETAAGAFGRLVEVLTPFIELAGELAASILPGLVPLFEGLGMAFEAMAPFAETLANALGEALVPLFTKLSTEVLPQLVPPLTELSTKIFPLLTEAITKLSPILTTIAEAFGNLVVALVPLIVTLIELGIQFTEKIMPVLQPLLDLIIKLTVAGFQFLADILNGVIIPIIEILVALIQGDFSTAWKKIQELVMNVARKVQEILQAMQDRIMEILGRLVDLAHEKFRSLHTRVVSAVQQMLNRLQDLFFDLPGMILSAIGDLGNLLVSAGGNLVLGLINGIRGKLGALRDIAAEVGSTVKNAVTGFLGIESPSKVMMEVGGDTMDGFLLGLQDKVPDLRSTLQGIATAVPSFALPDGRTLQLPQSPNAAPTVQVFIGNEQLDGHFDARIAQSNQARDRLAITGVRR